MKKFMQAAIEKARQGIARGSSPFGACIVKGTRILALEHNRVWQQTDPTAHAEVTAIRQACRKLRTIDLSGATIYSTTEPCPMCFSAIHWARISDVVFGTRILDVQRLGFNELTLSNARMRRLGHSSVRVHGGFMRPENLALLREWQALPKAKPY